VTQQDRAPFRPDIEGLRAVAVVAVVLYHAGIPGIAGGYIGVDVFFVISSFLITGLLWREVQATKTVALGRFYAARARRLLPAAATVGVVTALVAAAVLPPLQARRVFIDGIASMLYVGNYRFAAQNTDYMISDLPPSPFQHYWSLGVEEQFYLVWPALIIGTAWLARRIARGDTPRNAPYLAVVTLVGAASLAAAVIWTHTSPPWAFFSLPTRAWELAAGALVALTIDQWKRLPLLPATVAGWGGLALILLTCTQLGPHTPYPGTSALLPVLGTALVIGAGSVTGGMGVGRVLCPPVMRAIGRVSYSWYLWHWPVLLLLPPLRRGAAPFGEGESGRRRRRQRSCGMRVRGSADGRAGPGGTRCRRPAGQDRRAATRTRPAGQSAGSGGAPGVQPGAGDACRGRRTARRTVQPEPVPGGRAG
jgi:peptidoglycan/LPS O-acetylase OafA/YrhL